MSEKTKTRAWELDFARGIAVLLMSAFHAVFDLSEYFGVNVSYADGFWFYVGRLSAIMFMFVSGVSSSFSRNLIKRGLIVLGCGMVITVVSIPFMGTYYVRFGILHFFGTVMILKGLLELFVKDTKKLSFIAAALIPVSILLGKALPKIRTDNPMLLPLGVMPRGFASFDYYPIFPWLAFFSAGVVVSSLIYKDRKSIFGAAPDNPAANAICFLGVRSLIVYLLHQPVIMAILYIVFNISYIFS